jgi:hypothetical protein
MHKPFQSYIVDFVGLFILAVGQIGHLLVKSAAHVQHELDRRRQLLVTALHAQATRRHSWGNTFNGAL